MKKLKTLLIITLLLFTMIPVVSANSRDKTTYTVKYGDTLWKIAQKYKVDISEIINGNSQIKDINTIYPGQKINIHKEEQTNTEHKQTSEKAQTNTEEKQTTNQNEQLSSFEQQVIDLTNQERAKSGLKPLKVNTELSKVARTKSQDMINKNYFSHTSPTYGSPFDMMKSFGISYKAAGENIAKGQKTPQQVVTGWMNSEGHRKNILNSSYTEIGVGYAVSSNGTAHWTQMFIGK